MRNNVLLVSLLRRLAPGGLMLKAQVVAERNYSLAKEQANPVVPHDHRG